jgi:hypothetical protein
VQPPSPPSPPSPPTCPCVAGRAAGLLRRPSPSNTTWLLSEKRYVIYTEQRAACSVLVSPGQKGRPQGRPFECL